MTTTRRGSRAPKAPRGPRVSRPSGAPPPKRAKLRTELKQALPDPDLLTTNELQRFIPTLEEMEHTQYLLESGWRLTRNFVLPDVSTLMLALALIEWVAATKPLDPDCPPIRIHLDIRLDQTSNQAAPRSPAPASPTTGGANPT